MLSAPVLNATGQVAFLADLKNTSGGFTDNTGIYLHNGSALVNRARENAAVPEGNGLFNSFDNPVLNAAGQVAFSASLTNTSGGSADNSGIYLHDGSALVNRVRGNAAVPEGNGLFDQFNRPVLNAAGQVAFYASLKNTSGGLIDDTGIYLHNGSSLVNRVRENAAVPEGNGLFDGFGDPVLNAAGQVAFYASLKNTSGGFADTSGIYLHNGTSLMNIARANAAVPEGNGQFGGFNFLALNAAGQVAFNGNLKNTSGGTADDAGIYLTDGVEQLKVIRKGDSLAGKSVSAISLATGSGGQDGRGTGLNDFAQVAYSADFTSLKE